MEIDVIMLNYNVKTLYEVQLSIFHIHIYSNVYELLNLSHNMLANIENSKSIPSTRTIAHSNHL